MNRTFALAVSVLLVSAAPAAAGTFQIYEASLGGPGVTAQFVPGSDLVADIDFDASSAEGGSLHFGATNIVIVPLGDAVLVAFTCQIAGCTEDVDYTFTPGGAGVGSIQVDDPSDPVDPMTGMFELGDITWDSLASGSLYLSGCDYSSPAENPVERTCDPFTLAQTPEPGSGALLGFALGALALARRGRS